MKRVSSEVLHGSNVGFRLADGRSVFSHLNFSFSRGRHGLIGVDPSACTSFCRLIGGAEGPSEGAISLDAGSRLYFGPADEVERERTIADELGHGPGVRAIRMIRAGVVDPKLFEIQADDWDADDDCSRALTAVGLEGHDLLESLQDLSSSELALVRWAAVELRRPEVLVWARPTDKISEVVRLRLIDFLTAFIGTLIAATRDQELLRSMQRIWRLSADGLTSHDGNIDAYMTALEEEAQAADEALERAELDLQERVRLANEAHERRRLRRDRAQQFADTGIPKVHRGNLKRKSQETIAKAKANDEHKIKEAEALLQRARETRDQIGEQLLP